MSELARTALAIERELLEKFDDWMSSRGYASRSEAIRDLIRAALAEGEWARPKPLPQGPSRFAVARAAPALTERLRPGGWPRSRKGGVRALKAAPAMSTKDRAAAVCTKPMREKETCR